MNNFVEIILKVKKEDIIESKNGMLFVSPTSNKSYIVKKIKVKDNNKVEVIGEKQEYI